MFDIYEKVYEQSMDVEFYFNSNYLKSEICTKFSRIFTIESLNIYTHRVITRLMDCIKIEMKSRR